MVIHMLKNKKQFFFFPCLPLPFLLCILLLPPTTTRFNFAIVGGYNAKFQLTFITICHLSSEGGKK